MHGPEKLIRAVLCRLVVNFNHYFHSRFRIVLNLLFLLFVWSTSVADLVEQFRLTRDVGFQLEAVHTAIRQIRSIREQAGFILEKTKNKEYNNSLKSSFEAMDKKLAAIEGELIQTMNESGQDPINYPPKLDNQLAYLMSLVNSQDSKPTAGCYQRLEDLKKEFQSQKVQLDSILEKDLKEFNRMLEKEKASLIIL